MPKEVRVAGAAVRDQNAVLEELAGVGAMERAIARLAPDQRDELASMLAVSWVRTSTVIALMNAVAAELQVPPLELQARVVRRSIERTLKTVWRILLRVTSDHALVTRTPLLYNKTHDTGTMVPTVHLAGRAECELRDWPEVPEMSLQGIAIGIETVLRLAGRRDPRVVTERKPFGAHFVMTWRR